MACGDVQIFGAEKHRNSLFFSSIARPIAITAVSDHVLFLERPATSLQNTKSYPVERGVTK
jgi:hypothetical protein